VKGRMVPIRDGFSTGRLGSKQRMTNFTTCFDPLTAWGIRYNVLQAVRF
jgi:hypothetical protein